MRVRNLLRLKAYGDYYDKYSQTLEREVIARTADLVERSNVLEQQAVVLASQAALLDLAQDAIVVRDMQGLVLFWSRGAEVMYGWTSREALGRSAYDLLHATFSEPIELIESTLLRKGQWEGEAVHRTSGGTELIVASRWTLQRGVDGAPLRILTIDNDITGRKQADSDRRILTQRLSLATAVAKVGVWEWDLPTNMLTWDATMFDIYGMSPVVPMAYSEWSAVVHQEDLPAVEASLQRVIAEKGDGTSEFRIFTKNGAVRNISAVERVVLDESMNVSRVIGVHVDVTERKDSELALEQNGRDQMRFKDEFLSHVSHELRSPLTAIKQFTSILLSDVAGRLNDEQRQYQQIVLKNIHQLQSMIDDLLEVTHLETGKLTIESESVSVPDAVTDIINTLRGSARAKGVTLTSDFPPDLPPVQADQTRLRQILIILLDNAIKFTPDGGSIKIRARVHPQDPDAVLFEVSDTGCGISADIAERLFERLYQVPRDTQASRKGLGLGLYICKELIIRQSGQIWVKSEPEKGSTFFFTLPIFSLSNLMAPLLKNDQWPSESAALVMITVGLPKALSSRESRQEWSREVRNLLQRCLLPDMDVLLPTMSQAAEGERFFVVAFADEKGASILANRIRRQFERLPSSKQTGLTIKVSHRMLHSFPQPLGTPIDAMVSSLVSHLEVAINSPNHAGVFHE
ncbi:MAG: ATP-binding protein [Gemmatimonadota bacterium]